MTYLLVRHKVADFDAWKEVFDSHAEAQGEFGMKIDKVLRSIDDPNNVFLWFEVSNLDKAREFVTSPEVPQAMKDSGVTDTPDIHFLA